MKAFSDRLIIMDELNREAAAAVTTADITMNSVTGDTRSSSAAFHLTQDISTVPSAIAAGLPSEPFQLTQRGWILQSATSKPLVNAFPHGLYDWFY